MALDPEQFITLTRSRPAESARGSIVRDRVAAPGTQADREGEPAIPNFEPIKILCGFAALVFNRAPPSPEVARARPRHPR
jgi:hypothetical protein